ncbi:sensor domain-containing diguanylate cyclase [Nocardioides sp. Iso805N]|uniref:sensor domain-containing diguanylate cyclase n=1 Tax=Nocardioides sp. Iso805N TaxID=1283287 RepID=UPI00037DD8BD|nr:sensor domain-containing diguanylate cyclase [Nocardioides sp. Iso805N]
MSRLEQDETSAPAIARSGLSWRQRAELVRGGAAELADAPAQVGLALMRDLFETILRTSFDGVVLCDRVSGEYLEVSDSYCRLTGYTRAELLGRSSAELGVVDPLRIRQIAEADASLGHEGMYENTIVRRDGQELVAEFTHSFLKNGYTLVMARDVTARKAREASLHRLALMDELTGVLNRRGFRTELDAALDVARAGRGDLHVLIADADNLKQFNDDLGHEYGDQLLATTAVTLCAATAPQGVVGRLGGDEFAAFLPTGSRADAEAIVTRILAGLPQHRIGPPDDARPVSASIGLASASEVGYEADGLLSLADARMYHAKRR